MKKNIINIAVAATLGLAAFAATAEDMYRGAWYLLPGISYMHTDDSLDASNGGGGFIKLGKELSPSWDLQGGIGYNQADNDISNVSGHYKQTTLALDALYMFSRDKFRPFLLAGLGAARNNVDYGGLPTLENKSRTSYLAEVGAGAQYLFSDSFGLQADIRQQFTRSSAKAPGTSFDADGSLRNTLVSLGAIFRFGAPAAVAALPESQPLPEPTPAAEPAPAPAPAPVAAEPCKPQFETVTIEAEKLFGFDKSKLQEGSKPVLDAAAAKIKANPAVGLVLVTGHTDRLGSDAYNQKLSERRANTVKEYLISQGVDSSRLQAVGKGESEPVVTCDGPKSKKLIECLQPNRRVVISAEKQVETGCK